MMHVADNHAALSRCKVSLETCDSASVHVHVDVFMNDIWASYHHDTRAAHRQMRLDVPRIVLLVDGVVVVSPPPIPMHMLPLCTQAVMGLAVQVLHEYHMVGERSIRTPLFIHFFNHYRSFVAYKGLRTLPDDNDVRISVGNDGDDYVCIHFERERGIRHESDTHGECAWNV